VRSTLIDLKFSEISSATLFTTARQQLRVLNAFDGRAPALSQIALWESARSIQLPWLEKLSVQDVLRLRQEAATALPAFRASFVQELVRADGDVATAASAIDRIRAEALAVEQELSDAKIGKDRLFRNTYGLLGMSLAIYGFASGQALTGATGLLAVLGYLHQNNAKHKAAIPQASRRPGYALVKAKQLVEHVEDRS
jgi:hypothetical protein